MGRPVRQAGRDQRGINWSVVLVCDKGLLVQVNGDPATFDAFRTLNKGDLAQASLVNPLVRADQIPLPAIDGGAGIDVHQRVARDVGRTGHRLSAGTLAGLGIEQKPGERIKRAGVEGYAYKARDARAAQVLVLDPLAGIDLDPVIDTVDGGDEVETRIERADRIAVRCVVDDHGIQHAAVAAAVQQRFVDWNRRYIRRGVGGDLHHERPQLNSGQLAGDAAPAGVYRAGCLRAIRPHRCRPQEENEQQWECSDPIVSIKHGPSPKR